MHSYGMIKSCLGQTVKKSMGSHFMLPASCLLFAAHCLVGQCQVSSLSRQAGCRSLVMQKALHCLGSAHTTEYGMPNTG